MPSGRRRRHRRSNDSDGNGNPDIPAIPERIKPKPSQKSPPRQPEDSTCSKQVNPSSVPTHTCTSSSRSAPAVPPPPPPPQLPPPPNWPEHIRYLTHPVLSPFLPASHRTWLRTKPTAHAHDGASEVLPSIPIRIPPDREDDVRSRVEIRTIDDENHPAHGQRGLFAARDLPPNTLVAPYFGLVHAETWVEQAEWENARASGSPSSGEDACGGGGGGGGDDDEREAQQTQIGRWDTSSYDLNMHRSDTLTLAIDAAHEGNEARIVNDYRGVPAPTDTHAHAHAHAADRARKAKRRVKGWDEHDRNHEHEREHERERAHAMPNAEFRDVWFEFPRDLDLELELELELDRPNDNDNKKRKREPNGMRGVAVFVMPAGRAGKRRCGVRRGQEILVSYGKGFWAHRGGGVDGHEEMP